MAARAITQQHKAYRLAGIADLERNVAKVIDSVAVKRMKDTYVRAGVPIRDAIRGQIQTQGLIRTGRLLAAAFVSKGDPQKPDALVGISHRELRRARGAFYAAFLERGTRTGIRARHFVRRGLATGRPEAAQIIKTGLQEQINRFRSAIG
jgi:hypothetical protein